MPVAQGVDGLGELGDQQARGVGHFCALGVVEAQVIPERHDAAAPEPGQGRAGDRSLPRLGFTRSEGLAAHQPCQGFRWDGQGLEGFSGHASDD